MQALLRLFGHCASAGFAQKARSRLRPNVGDRCKHALEAEWIEPHMAGKCARPRGFDEVPTIGRRSVW
jgi:hypothetical protein